MFSSVSGRNQSNTSATHRVDLGQDATHHREIAMDAEAARALDGGNVQPEGEDEGRRLFIYGTRICVMTVKTRFREFLTQFQPSELADDERAINVNDVDRVELNPTSEYYMERLMECDMTESSVLNVNLKHVLEFDESLYKMIVAYPAVSFFSIKMEYY